MLLGDLLPRNRKANRRTTMKRADVRCLAVTLGAMALMAAPAALADGSGATGFPQPEIRQSKNGVLQTTLRAHIAPNQITDQLSGETRWVYTPTYAGTIPGPTLILNPG